MNKQFTNSTFTGPSVTYTDSIRCSSTPSPEFLTLFESIDSIQSEIQGNICGIENALDRLYSPEQSKCSTVPGDMKVSTLHDKLIEHISKLEATNSRLREASQRLNKLI